MMSGYSRPLWITVADNCIWNPIQQKHKFRANGRLSARCANARYYNIVYRQVFVWCERESVVGVAERTGSTTREETKANMFLSRSLRSCVLANIYIQTEIIFPFCFDWIVSQTCL